MALKKQTKRKPKSKAYTRAKLKKYLATGVLDKKKGHVKEILKKPEPIREPIVETDAKLLKRTIKA